MVVIYNRYIYGVHFVLLLVAEVVAIADNNKLKNFNFFYCIQCMKSEN